MLKTALKFVEHELGKFMLERDRDSYTTADETVSLGNIVKKDGSPVSTAHHIYITLTHIEEERFESKRPIYIPSPKDKTIKVYQPPVRLNANVLFTAIKDDYATALRDLSLVALFFQGHIGFDEMQYPMLNSYAIAPNPKPWHRIKELTFQMCTLTYEQQSYVWSTLGSKYAPSLMYKMRLLVVFDTDIENAAPPILEGQSTANGSVNR